MHYRLLALDMDGTLLSSGKEVLPRTRDALKELAARGTDLAYCTGRNVLELQEYPSELPFIGYGVLASGAIVYDFERKLNVSLHPLDPQVAIEAMHVTSEERPMVHIMTVRESVARPDDVRNMPRFGMGVYQGMFERICTYATDLDAWVQAHPHEIVKLNFYHTDAAARDRTRGRLEGAGLPLTLANAEQTSVECSALNVSKGLGLKELADHLGVSLSEVVAVGDSDNDAEALRVAGMPVAMGNATQGARALARIIVADNDHDGIEEVVRRLF